MIYLVRKIDANRETRNGDEVCGRETPVWLPIKQATARRGATERPREEGQCIDSIEGENGKKR